MNRVKAFMTYSAGDAHSSRALLCSRCILCAPLRRAGHRRGRHSMYPSVNASVKQRQDARAIHQYELHARPRSIRKRKTSQVYTWRLNQRSNRFFCSDGSCPLDCALGHLAYTRHAAGFSPHVMCCHRTITCALRRRGETIPPSLQAIIVAIECNTAEQGDARAVRVLTWRMHVVSRLACRYNAASKRSSARAFEHRVQRGHPLVPVWPGV